jgi:MtrB/PioB family decaheme-associated outer membrane protein
MTTGGRLLTVAMALLLTAPSRASAQATGGAGSGLTNEIDFGFRGTHYDEDGDRARYQRYRDVRNGPTLDRFRFTSGTAEWSVHARADHVGYRDQEYRAAYDRYGTLKAEFEWSQIPLFFSETTASLYSSTATGTLLFPDGVQSGVQNGTISLTDAATQSVPFNVRHRRDVARATLDYSATEHLDLDVEVRSTAKSGSQPWAGTFGFSNAVELALPFDHRTTEVGAGLEWSSDRGLLRLAYDGSFFRNHVPTLVWDNPKRIGDSPSAGSSHGREAFAPDNTVNAGSVTASVSLPGRSRAMAYVSIGNWSQNDALIPFTINTQLPVIPLDRPDAWATARVTAMNYSFTSRPTRVIWLSARYRQYDFDNRTPLFHVTDTVSYDQRVTTFPGEGAVPHGYVRRTADAEISATPLRQAAFRVGYTREEVERTFRYVDETTDDILRASIDLSGTAWWTVRGVYEYASRTGSGFDEQALDDIGEQVALRQFDVSDRTSHRVSAIVELIPAATFSVNGSVSVGREARPDTVFGLRSNDTNGYSVGFDFVPRDEISVGMSYGYEEYHTLQASRQANSGRDFDDPTKDWTTDGHDTAHTLTVSADVLKVVPNTEFRFAYDLSRAESLYVYALAPNSTLPPPEQLPPVLNRLQRATFDARYFLNARTSVGVVYWLDKYDVDDFALGPFDSLAQPPTSTPTFLMIGYYYRPYTANTVMAHVTYLW